MSVAVAFTFMGIGAATTVSQPAYAYAVNSLVFTPSVTSGMTVTGETVEAGTQTIYDGGTTSSTTIDNAGIQDVSSGGTAISTTVNAGGTQNVFDGGVASDTVLTSAGVQNVEFGGSAVRTVVGDGGRLVVELGGATSSTTIEGGGGQALSGRADDTLINSSGVQSVLSGGVAATTTVNAGGLLQVEGGGTAYGVVQNSGAALVADTNATVNGTNALGVDGFSINQEGNHTATNVFLENGGALTVLDGGRAISTTIGNGGTQTVQSGGYASSTTVSTGGQESLEAGARASGTVLESGGRQVVSSGATASGTTINGSGTLQVMDGGTATDSTQNDGGALVASTSANVTGSNTRGTFVIDGALHSANNVLLENGGVLSVLSDGTAEGTTVGDGGALTVQGGGVLVGTTQVIGTGQLGGNVINNGQLTFNPSVDNVVGASIHGAGSLEKDGGNVLTLTGRLDYTGGSTVSGGTLRLDGSSGGGQLTGDVRGANGSRLDLVNGAVLTGRIEPLNVNIDTASRWTMTGNSVVDNLTLAGQVDFAAPALPFATPRTLTLQNLSGNGGLVTLNVALADSGSVSDKVIVNGAVTGTTNLRIRNAGGLGAQTTGDGIPVVESPNGPTAKNAFTLQHRVVAGAYEYSMRQGTVDQNDWFLTSEQTSGGGGVPNYSAEASLYSVIPTLGLAYNNTLMSAVVQDTPLVNDRGLWGKVISEFPRSGASGGLYDNAAKLHGEIYSVVVGKDLYTQVDPGVSHAAGLYASFGIAKADVEHYDGGNAGDMLLRSYAIGGYFKHIEDRGLYMKGQMQVSWQSEDASSSNNHSLHTNGWGAAVAVEGGVRKALTDVVAIQPAVRFSFQHLALRDTQDVTSDITFGGTDSMVTSLGAKVSRTWDIAPARTLTAWFRPEFAYEFLASAQTTFTAGGASTSVKSDRSGASLVLASGVNGWVKKDIELNLQVNYAVPLSGNPVEGLGVRLGAKKIF
ncbi:MULTISPECIES: AIDA repeat-containing protein [Paraburkholderia]|uniref:AIDA repeat-containing protein n=1 Tax=Paraburkholderia TaxID=1822464 RepID=UPI00225C1888|nr:MULTISPECIES: AIDA repeat-containing protein [Paraburkholderia]MCX4159325.1 AIDA repeat-containing protein [Paraburkholderia aspalathi]MDN7168724.1 autotransporter adhesin family protein [Paraburkholderia sp. SECH2]MDQ6397211.1 autotransporter adhesin family protein [Paraburkholderia aspalathi]